MSEKFYAITIKCNVKNEGFTAESIMGIYRASLDKVNGINLVSQIEKDSKGKNHLHGYFKTKKQFRYTDLKVQGWTVYLRRVYEHTGWYRYLMKDVETHQSPEKSLEDRVKDGEYCFI